ncbi:hypothetical protein B0H34DRAFT_714212, partial [Crassisporium funariophilum]
MCVESAALIAVFNVAFLILYLVNIQSLLFVGFIVPLFFHAYIISPFLIVYRVAQGKAWSNQTRTLLTQDIYAAGNGQRLPSLQFARSCPDERT